MSKFYTRQFKLLKRSAGLCASLTFSIAVLLGTTTASFAEIENTVVASGTAPGGPVDGVQASASESVDVVDAAPALTVVKTATLNDEVNVDGFAEAGETITYTFDVTNSGNVTITNVNVNDTANGTNGAVVPGGEIILTDIAPLADSTDAAVDGAWDSIAPGDTVRFTGTYTVNQTDVDTLQ